MAENYTIAYLLSPGLHALLSFSSHQLVACLHCHGFHELPRIRVTCKTKAGCVLAQRPGS